MDGLEQQGSSGLSLGEKKIAPQRRELQIIHSVQFHTAALLMALLAARHEGNTMEENNGYVVFK
jgi:hypothetical protein